MHSLLQTANRLYCGAAMSVFSRFPPGTNIYDRDWDLLIILDTCRVDALREVALEYDWLGEVESHWSLGSSSPEFMSATFTEDYREEISNTVYISGNAHTEWVFENRSFPEKHRNAILSWTNWDTVHADDFQRIDNVWRYTEEMISGLSDPQNIADRAIATGRELNSDRMIVHFNQPHSPHAARALTEDRSLKPQEEDPFKAIRDGISRENIWAQYLDEIRYTMKYVNLVLTNFDAKTAIISADHGELFGKYLFSHPSGVLHPDLRKVPWAEVGATDKQTYEPELEYSDETVVAAEDRLEKLGYL